MESDQRISHKRVHLCWQILMNSDAAVKTEERKFSIVTGGFDGISGLIRRSCLVSTMLILVQIGSDGFRWIQMDLKWKMERKFSIVTGVDGISGLIRRSCHPDPPIATILTPPAEPPAEREADPIHLEWLLQIGTSFTHIDKSISQKCQMYLS